MTFRLRQTLVRTNVGRASVRLQVAVAVALHIGIITSVISNSSKPNSKTLVVAAAARAAEVPVVVGSPTTTKTMTPVIHSNPMYYRVRLGLTDLGMPRVPLRGSLGNRFSVVGCQSDKEKQVRYGTQKYPQHTQKCEV